MLETSTQYHAVPTFSIFKGPMSDEKVESLIHCFIDRIYLDVENPPAVIKAKDGLVYTAAYDCRLPPKGRIGVIISFQEHTFGRFAIIRLAQRTKTVRLVEQGKLT